MTHDIAEEVLERMCSEVILISREEFERRFPRPSQQDDEE